MEYKIVLPTLSSLEFGNVWTGSRGNVRWRILPASGVMHAEVWRGPMCRECSTVETEQDFPLTEEGLEELRAWLAEQSEK